MQDPNQHHYAIFRNDGNSVGLLSMKPLKWPVSPDIPVTGDVDDAILPWQTVLPEHCSSIDQLVIHLAYASNLEQLNIDQYVEMDETTWNEYCERWMIIRQYHREYILHHPQCINDQYSRQQWLSRLMIAHPRVFMLIAELRLLKWSVIG